MTWIKNNWFIISTGLAPLYKNPSFNSNYLSEVVHGDSCKILDMQDNWIHVECDDGYRGWVNKFYGFACEKKNNPSYIIAYPNGEGLFNARFPFGARLTKKRTGSIAIDQYPNFDNITKVLNNLIGIPYKWGGKTSLGFDCSGLVQSVLQVFGFKIPRDSKDQWHFLDLYTIDLDRAKKGDLHFFGKDDKINHVGFSCGGAEIIHSQGSVKKESLNKNHANFNKSLLDIYLASASIRLKFKL